MTLPPVRSILRFQERSISDDEDDIVWLLQLSGRSAAFAGPLDACRRMILESIGQRISADAGWWAWGQGVPGKSQVTPLAFIHTGFTPAQLALHVEAALQPETDTMLRSRVMPSLEHAPQNTHLWNELISDEEWYGSRLYKEYYAAAGFDRHVNAVRYFERDFFSNASYCRKAGRPPFDERERKLLDRALAGITQMHIAAAEAVPPAVLNVLTPRQRTVMLMLLDGQSRGQIAHGLGISTHTVNEHVKQLYVRFEVNAIGELAAKFLQSRR